MENENTNEYQLDPAFQAHEDSLRESREYWEEKDKQDDIENAEATAAAKQKEKKMTVGLFTN